MKAKQPLLCLSRGTAGRIEGNVIIPPSKSETNRALVIGAFSPKPFTIRNYSRSDDSLVFIDFLQQSGVEVELTEDVCIVKGNVRDSNKSEARIFLKHAGTGLRFLTALAVFLNGSTILDGSERLRSRPIKELIDSLAEAGAKIEYLEETGCLPIRVHGDPELDPTSFKLDVSKSSQMLTALMLIAPKQMTKTRLYFDESKIVSRAYIELTQKMLAQLGINWNWKASCLELEQREFVQNEYTVGGDWTSASYLLGIAATTEAKLTLENLSADSFQGDKSQLDIFESWGLLIKRGDNRVYVENPSGNLVQSQNCNLQNMPDLTQTFAVLAAYADEPSHLFGLQTLPHKETDRLSALAVELQKLGCQTETGADDIKIKPARLEQNEPVQTYDDHRMALSFSLLANKLGIVKILNPEVVTKSYPNYWETLESLGYIIERSDAEPVISE